MIDYGYKDPPWKANKDSIKSILINDGVTRIGNSAFSKANRKTYKATRVRKGFLRKQPLRGKK